MTKTVTPAEWQRISRSLVDRLRDHKGLEDVFLRAVLDEAQGVAAGHPTPQSRMAAEGMGVRNGTILSLSGGPSAAVAAGSEFGSGIYRQFGPRRTRGYWLLPTGEDPGAGTIGAGDDWVEDQIEASIRGF